MTRAFHTPYPEAEDTLSIYYALQEAGLPCLVVRSPDPAMIRLELAQPSNGQIAADRYAERVQAFVAGWVACHYREALPYDEPFKPPLQHLSTIEEFPNRPAVNPPWKDSNR